MPRPLPPLDVCLPIGKEARRLQMLHITPTISPRIPKDLKARTTLGKNLEYIGLGPRLMNFPWSITSATMVSELTQNRPILEEVQHVVY
jgi:hypothetical protein